MIGFMTGCGVGYGLGLASVTVEGCIRSLDPILSIIYPIRKNLVATSGVGRLGLGDAPRQFISPWALFSDGNHTTTGVKNNRFTLFCDGYVYGAPSDHDFLAHSITWQFCPWYSRVRIAFNSAFVVTVAVELNTPVMGWATSVWEAWQTMRTEYLYAIVVIAFIGVLSPLYYERSESVNQVAVMTIAAPLPHRPSRRTRSWAGLSIMLANNLIILRLRARHTVLSYHALNEHANHLAQLILTQGASGDVVITFLTTA